MFNDKFESEFSKHRPTQRSDSKAQLPNDSSTDLKFTSFLSILPSFFHTFLILFYFSTTKLWAANKKDLPDTNSLQSEQVYKTRVLTCTDAADHGGCKRGLGLLVDGRQETEQKTVAGHGVQYSRYREQTPYQTLNVDVLKKKK